MNIEVTFTLSKEALVSILLMLAKVEDGEKPQTYNIYKELNYKYFSFRERSNPWQLLG